MTAPATRSLEAVLRAALHPAGGLRILVATYDTTPSADARYANVVLDGTSLTLPNLNAAGAGPVGTPAYILADPAGRMFVLGTVATGIPAGGGPAFISKAGAPTAGDGNNGDTYLDTTSRRLYGPKAAGAWPASTSRVLPLAPTYAQIKSG